MIPESKERGFSLVELMIAMTVTMIVTGAIVALVGSGQNSFRREPEISDRQQSIRTAMALISGDVHNAGAGLPPFTQTLTNNLDGLGPVGPTGANADELEIFATSDCPVLSVCGSDGVSIASWESLSACYALPTLVILSDGSQSGIFWAEKPGAGGVASCGAGGGGGGGGGGGNGNGHVALPPGRDRFYNPPGGPGFNPTTMALIQVIRYRIQTDAEGVPNLWRSAYGGENLPTGESSWQLIARGVEDLQVRYRNGNAWADIPGTVSCGANCAAPTAPEYNTIVRETQITLSARTTAPNLLGATQSAAGTAIRGQLTTQISPRNALLAISGGGQWF